MRFYLVALGIASLLAGHVTGSTSSKGSHPAGHWVAAWTSMPQLTEPANLPNPPFNTTGLVFNGTVIGGENTTLAQPVLPGQLGIYVGSGTTQSTYTAPSATIAAWESFAATAITSASFSALPTAGGAP